MNITGPWLANFLTTGKICHEYAWLVNAEISGIELVKR
jgi:hypothetical protein